MGRKPTPQNPNNMAKAFVQTLKDMKTDEVRYVVVVKGLPEDEARELARRIQATIDKEYK